MDFYRPINKFVVSPLYYWRLGDKRLKRLSRIEPVQYWTSEEISQLQFKRLKKLIRHAYKNTRYYRRVFDEHKFTPEDMHQLSDIQYLPFLTKNLIQEHLHDLVAINIPKERLVQDSLGRTTGKPVTYYKDKEGIKLRSAVEMRHDRWCGWDLGDQRALVTGAPDNRNAKDGWDSIRERVVIKLVAREINLNAFDLNPGVMSRYRRILEVHQPTLIQGYAGALFHFAESLFNQFPDHKIRPKGLISFAEPLSEEKRSFIERVFKARVLNRYGSKEMGLIASECQEQKGLHINADNLVVEVLHQDTPIETGERGDIVVTDLWNYGMPFIRYKIEDVGSLAGIPCPCGRGLPLLARIDGRSSDFFLSEDGSRIHGEYFTDTFYNHPEVKHFQLIQQEKDLIELKVVESTANAKHEYLSELEHQIKTTLGNQVVLAYSIVDEIALPPSGRLRTTFSKV